MDGFVNSPGAVAGLEYYKSLFECCTPPGYTDGYMQEGLEHGVEVSICGDMAGNPDYTAVLLRAGLRTLSVAPADLGRMKAAIAGITLGRG